MEGEEPGTSASVPAKKSRKAHASSKEAKNLAAWAKKELRLHQAVERSIQRALEEASVRDVPGQSAPPRGIIEPGLSGLPSGDCGGSYGPAPSFVP